MLVTMNNSRKGSEDGFTVKQYNQGHYYNIADSLAAEFIRLGWASPAAPTSEQLMLAKSVLGKVAAGAPVDSNIQIWHNLDLIRVADFLEQISEILAAKEAAHG